MGRSVSVHQNLDQDCRISPVSQVQNDYSEVVSQEMMDATRTANWLLISMKNWEKPTPSTTRLRMTVPHFTRLLP